MKEMMKNTGILLAITLIAGLLLGLVYQVTKAPIAEQEAKAKQEACQEVFADAATFEAVELWQWMRAHGAARATDRKV